MTPFSAVNALIRFGLELCALAALGYWGFRASDSFVVEWLLGLGAPLAFALLWGGWVAPRASRRLPDPARLGLEVIVFTVAAVALAGAGQPFLAAVFAVAVAVNLGLMVVLGQRGAI